MDSWVGPLLILVAWVVQMGFTDWRPIFEWKIANTIARTNGTSGWLMLL